MKSVRSLEGVSAFRFHSYRGLRVMPDEGHFALRGLRALRLSLLLALATNPRVLVLKFELAVPTGLDLPDAPTMLDAIRRCFQAIQASARKGQQLAQADPSKAHNVTIRYFWRRDALPLVRPAYSLAVFLNREAYSSVRHYRSGWDNDFSSGLLAAWAQVLGQSAQAARLLVKHPGYSVLHVRRGQGMGLSSAFQSLSPLCQTLHDTEGKSPTFGFGRV